MNNKKIKLGQFYTSNLISNFMVNLISNNKNKDNVNILEPGIGDGVFIKELKNNGYRNISGCDIDKINIDNNIKKFPELKLKNINYLDTHVNKKYDIIIGNPPYVQWNNIDVEIRNFLKNNSFWNKYSNGEWDLLYAFIIWSIEKLKEEGELIFIVPFNWFNSTYASSLREYLIDNGYFEYLIHFGEYKLFQDCFPNNIIFKYIKSKNKEKPILVVDYKNKKGNVQDIINKITNNLEKIKKNKNYFYEDEDFSFFSMEQFQEKDFWFLAPNVKREIIKKIELRTNNITLKDYLKISVGIVSGFDKAYLINEEDFNKFNENEKKFIFPFVKAKNCKRYNLEGKTFYLFPDKIENENKLSEFQNIYNHLIKYKEKLDERYMSKNKNWWNWATVRNLNLFIKNLNEPKIFIPCRDRSLKSRYSISYKNFFGSGDVLMIVKKNNLKEDIRYVLAWLNSNIINEWYSIKGSKMGHRINYTQIYVSEIPYLKINFENKSELIIYENILNNVNQLLINYDERIENEIDILFEKLINLYTIQ